MGSWESSPYFHDGSAETIDKVFETTGGQIIQAETALLSNGANISGYIQINADSSSHGEYVRFPSNSGASLSLSSIDGGSGGIGAIEIRVLYGQSTTLNLDINGTVYPIIIPSSSINLDWRLLRINDVVFNAGLNNTLTLTLTSNPSASIDEILISTSDDLTSASPHRVAQNLNALDFLNLIAYIQELDGSDSSVPGDLIFENGFESP